MKLILLIFSILAFLMGCKKPDPQPELRDPIYLDISAALKNQEAEVKRLKKEVEDNKSNLDKIEPYTRQDKDFWQKFWASEKSLAKAEQKLHFLNLHLIHRKYAARNSYIKAWNKGLADEWPSESIEARYKLNKRLKNAPRTWDSQQIANQINKN